MPSSWSAREERQYQHVLASTGDKAIAAGVVNKNRAKHGKTKSAKRKRSKPRR